MRESKPSKMSVLRERSCASSMMIELYLFSRKSVYKMTNKYYKPYRGHLRRR